MKGRTPFSDLASLLQTSARRAATDARRRPHTEVGTMQADGSLVLDSLTALVFAPGEYLTLRQNLLPNPMTLTSGTAVGDHGTHTHQVVRPAELLPEPEYPAGTRVLVNWVFGLTTPVVVGALS